MKINFKLARKTLLKEDTTVRHLRKMHNAYNRRLASYELPPVSGSENHFFTDFLRLIGILPRPHKALNIISK